MKLRINAATSVPPYRSVTRRSAQPLPLLIISSPMPSRLERISKPTNASTLRPRLEGAISGCRQSATRNETCSQLLQQAQRRINLRGSRNPQQCPVPPCSCVVQRENQPPGSKRLIPIADLSNSGKGSSWPSPRMPIDRRNLTLFLARTSAEGKLVPHSILRIALCPNCGLL
jgi:hypothetical protein